MTHSERPGPPRQESVLVALAALALAAIHLGMAEAFGALGVARNDDWTYYRVAFASAANGGFDPDPYTNAMLVGLVALARPVIAIFGPEMVALQIFVAALGAAGLWACWWSVRHFLAPRLALLAVATLAVGPCWGGLTASFMTDVPAFAFQAAGLALGVRALRGGRLRWPWLFAAILTCLVAFSIREYAVAALVAVCLAALVVTGGLEPHAARRQRALIGVLALVSLLAAAALYRWRGAQTTGAPARSAFLLPSPVEFRAGVRTI
ncbi:MAG: glycosyltransferase family 39 protein, partial [Humibacillus sp.]